VSQAKHLADRVTGGEHQRGKGRALTSRQVEVVQGGETGQDLGGRCPHPEDLARSRIGKRQNAAQSDREKCPNSLTRR